MTADVAMPPRTPMPMDFCAAAPAPLAKASGMTPSMKASVVIRIGRSRMREASTAASSKGLPCFRSISANSTIRMAFRAARPMVVSIPTLK
ncbi:hypothetical protein PAYE108092_20845 [Paracoccus yeei]